MRDPIEIIVAEALDAADIGYKTDEGGDNPSNLDFCLENGVEIEVKQFHSDRIAEQMSRAENVIAIQGRGAAEWFSDTIRAMEVPSPWRDIESAPKDGTRCLFFAKANKQCFYKSGKKNQIRVDFWKDTGFHKMFPQCPYTHWMPLPDTPESPPS